MRPLPLVIGAVVVAGIVPSVVLLLLARQAHVAKTDPQPYVASAAVDADHQALARLRAGGFTCTFAVDGSRLVAAISGMAPSDARLVLMRPDDPTADTVIAWSDPRQPLSVTPGKVGRWRVRLEGVVDGVHARLIESAIDVGM